ncbi:CAF1 family ribonuclease [Emydomyces testavorans]|uniref:CAF1 family ribonuclease n=1 Tax=Emydomyces testavorans TaxID=2070801 RepID=A0AAF0ILX0_9EURO|nr:CAF1 family ribonuclease [Emydomyces testavorans]
MEVTKLTFNRALPRILNDIADSCCVALDLEFSGIFSRQNRKAPVDGSSGGGRTLQSRYEEVKEAAEKYQILQIGLTFIKEDIDDGTYILRPYNFYLNPVIDPKLDLERTWTYQSSGLSSFFGFRRNFRNRNGILRKYQAVDVLLNSGFRMEAPFTEGVSYISREEEENVKARIRGRRSRLAALDQISYDSLDAESIAFLAESRRIIDDWIKKADKKKTYVNFPGPESRSATPATINNYQKRLIHQLVRSEYPDLVSIGRPSFIQIVQYDKKREDKVQEEKLRFARERIYNQMGFRWIVEGMVGGDLSRLSPGSLLDPSRRSPSCEQDILGHFDYLQAKLKSKRLILVGHNLFTDLVYFYNCFFGNLPEKVEEFLHTIHDLFPIIVDTKYLATYDCGSDFPSSMLAEIDEKLESRETPIITIDSTHTRYAEQKLAHEAGYDSLMTARIFLRLAAHLSNKEEHLTSENHDLKYGNHDKSREETLPGSEKALANRTNIPPSNSIESAVIRSGIQRSKVRTAVSKHEEEAQITKESAHLASQQPAIAHRTRFDILTDRMDDNASEDSEVEVSLEEDLFLTSGGNPIIESKIQKGQLIPRLESEFWQVYGNKLRMFGTAQRFCELKDR